MSQQIQSVYASVWYSVIADETIDALLTEQVNTMSIIV